MSSAAPFRRVVRRWAPIRACRGWVFTGGYAGTGVRSRQRIRETQSAHGHDTPRSPTQRHVDTTTHRGHIVRAGLLDLLEHQTDAARGNRAAVESCASCDTLTITRAAGITECSALRDEKPSSTASFGTWRDSRPQPSDLRVTTRLYLRSAMRLQTLDRTRRSSLHLRRGSGAAMGPSLTPNQVISRANSGNR